MARIHTPTADPEPGLLDEADADLCDAHCALQALMDLLCACDPTHPVMAGRLRGLLQPIAGQVGQAAQALATYRH